MTPSSVITSQDPFQPPAITCQDPPQPLSSPPRIQARQWCHHHHFQDPLGPCSSPRIHHLESHAPPQLYPTVFWGHVAPTVVPLREPSTIHTISHCLRNGEGAPLTTLSPLRPFLMMSLPHSRLRLVPASTPPQTWPWPAPYEHPGEHIQAPPDNSLPFTNYLIGDRVNMKTCYHQRGEGFQSSGEVIAPCPIPLTWTST